MEKTRLPGLTGMYASPVAAANPIFFSSRNGKTLVIAPGDELTVTIKGGSCRVELFFSDLSEE